MSVTAAILGQVDRIAAGRTLSQSNYAGGVEFWPRVDAADDETYENRVKGVDVSAIDDTLALGAVWSTPTLRTWFTLHQSYIMQDLGLPPPFFTNWFQSIGKRAPYQFALALAEALGAGSALSPDRVFPPGIRPTSGTNPESSRMHKWGLLTGTTGDPTWEPGDALPADVRCGGVLLVNETSSPSPTDLKLTCTRVDASTVDLTVTLAVTTSYGQTILAAVSVDTGQAPAGQSTIPIAGGSTAMFKVGEPVLVHKSDTVQEVGIVDSISPNISITLSENLANSYAAGDLVIPMFTAVAWKSGTLGDGKKLGVYALPDRTIAL